MKRIFILYISIILFQNIAFTQTKEDPVPCNVEDSLVLIELKSLLLHYTWSAGNQWTEDSVYEWSGITLNSSGRVEKIFLRDRINLDFTGIPIPPVEVPDIFSQLPYLKELNLEENQLIGEIPDDIYEIENLEVLELNKNVLTGEINGNIGKLQKLKELNLSYNQISGNIPDTICFINTLELLNLDSNYFAGSIPDEIGNLTNLEELSLQKNALQGSLPENLFTCTKLKKINLKNNSFSGTISSQIGALVNLEYLNLEQNVFEGSLPSEFSSLTKLKYCYLGQNKLSGTLPSEIGNLNQLIKFEIDINNFSGEIPSTIGQLTNLEYLNLSFNLFSNLIPTQIGNLINLKELELSNNQLTGKIPWQVFMDSLHVIHLNNNLLSDTIPDNINQMDSVVSIRLDHNLLQGPVPSSIAELEFIQNIDLSNNRLTELPNLAPLINTLEFLKVSNNLLFFNELDSAGVFFLPGLDYIYYPQGFFNVSREEQAENVKFTLLDTTDRTTYKWFNQGNEINGEITDSLIVPNNEDGAFYCEIRDEIYPYLVIKTVPQATGDIELTKGILSSEYEALVTVYDSLGGDFWNNNQYWKTDTLAVYWKGVSLKDGIYVDELNLRANNLEGIIPHDIKNLTHLEELNFGSNKITDLIDFSDMENLSEIYFDANFLTEVPDFNLMENLEVLDLRFNQLDFGDIEPIIESADEFLYEKQAKIGETQVYSPIVGGNHTISITTPGNYNTYQWFKNGETISDANSSSYTITNFSLEDEGDYHCEVSNTIAPDLTLVSKFITIVKAFKIKFSVTDGIMPLEGCLVTFGDLIQTTTAEGDTVFYPVINQRDIPFEVSKPGYKTVSGDITVDDANVEMDIVMEPYTITFNIFDPADAIEGATIELEKYETVITEFDGQKIYSPVVPYERLAYKISKTGYIDAIDTVMIKDESLILDIELIATNPSKISIFPNPNNGYFNMHTTQSEENITVEIFTDRGIKVYTEQIEYLKDQSFDLTFLDEGIYYVRIYNADLKRIIKVIIGKE